MSLSNSVLYHICITCNESLNATLDQCIMCCFIHIFLPYIVLQDENDYPDQNPTLSSPTYPSPTYPSPTLSSPTLSSPTYPSPTLSSPTYPSPTYPENFFHIMDRE